MQGSEDVIKRKGKGAHTVLVDSARRQQGHKVRRLVVNMRARVDMCIKPPTFSEMGVRRDTGPGNTMEIQ